MPYRAGRCLPDPSERHLYLQVVNVYADAQTDLTPTAPVPDGLTPLRAGQDIPMIGERVTPDDDPNLRDI